MSPQVDARRIPPYARQLRARLASAAERKRAYGTSANGERVTFWVAAGADAWQWVRERPHFLATLLPSGEVPEVFDWSICHGQPPTLVVVVGTLPPDIPQRLAVAILRDGGERVIVYFPNGQSMRFVVERGMN